MVQLKNIPLTILSVLLLCASCKKAGDLANNPLLEQYFETNVLNRDFIVSLATDNSSDLTANYTGYTFVLLKTDYYHGPLKATIGSTVYMGTWTSNEDYSKLDISLPIPPAEFAFLSRSWRFTSKNFPTLKLSPWGSTEALELNMYRQ
ncbi:MAG: hypothetical protein ABI691_03955 [Ginsengibacter sp.]